MSLSSEIHYTYDRNGVRQIYPTKVGEGAEPWGLGYGDWEERSFRFERVSGEGHRTEIRSEGQVRMMVKATRSACDGETEQDDALRRGYMCSPADWKNYEFTAYFKLERAASDDGHRWLSLFGGGGIHSGHGPPRGCRGSAYIGSYHYRRAKVRFGKESYHSDYDDRDWFDVRGGIDMTRNRARWLGMKVVKYEFERGERRGVRNELWLDFGGLDAEGRPANEWFLALTEEDHPDQPSWGKRARRCDAPRDDQIIFWGGPFLTLRWDDSDVRARLVTAREITPP